MSDTAFLHLAMRLTQYSASMCPLSPFVLSIDFITVTLPVRLVFARCLIKNEILSDLY